MASELLQLAGSLDRPKPRKPASRELLELGDHVAKQETAAQKLDRLGRMLGGLLAPGAGKISNVIAEATGPTPARPGTAESLTAAPEAIAQYAQQPGAGAILQNLVDIQQAKAGDREAAKRVGARQELVSLAAGAVVPPGVSPLARAGLGALAGGGAGGLTAAVGGEPILPAVTSGAVLGGALGPVLGAVGGAAAPEAQTVSRETFAANPALGRVIQAIKEAPPLERAQQVVYKTARRERIQAARTASTGLRGEAAVAATLREMKGAMPKLQGTHFRGVEKQLLPDDVNALIEQARSAPGLRYYEAQVRGPLALKKVLAGQIPTKGEISLLDRIYGPQLGETVLSKRQFTTKEMLTALPGEFRTLMTSFDLSAPFRQGAFLVGRKEFYPAFANMFRLAASEKGYQALEKELSQRANAGLYDKFGLAITRAGRQLDQREEAFAGRLITKIPGVRASERAYTGFLNKLRADTFDNLLKSSERLGIDPNEVGPRIAEYVNAATGRGNLPGVLENSSAALATVLFSPRLIASRLSLLNPLRYAQALNPAASPGQRFIAREALRDLLTAGAAGATVLGLAKAGGAEVAHDPKSADFGKIKVGDNRLDVLGGFGQYIRLAARVATEKDKIKQIGRFARYKESPIVALAHNLLAGKDATGKTVTLPGEIKRLLTPLIIQDIQAALQDLDSPVSMAFSLLGGLGFGYQRYQQPQKKEKTPAEILP